MDIQSNRKAAVEATYIQKVSDRKKNEKARSKKVQRVVSSLVVLFCLAFVAAGGINLVSSTSNAYILKVDGEEVATMVSEKEAEKDIVRFVENLPEHFREHVKYVCENKPELYTDFMFHGDMTNHLYKELPAITVIPGCPHTPEGQAKFYRKVLKLFYKLDFICGAIVFSYSDCEKCAYCGQNDCPTETRWGLVDVKGNPKPSYYAVKELFGEFIEKDKSY